MKKIASLLLGASLCLSAVSAQAFTLTGFESERIGRDWSQSRFFTRMEELTGIPVTATAVNDRNEYAALLDNLAKGTIPADVLFKANLNRSQERQLLDAGRLVDLAPLIEENMPNLSALLEAHPEWRAAIELDDGRIASLPLLNQQERQVCVWINSAWLQQLGLEMPKTLDELTAALVQMQSADLNGNHKPDEIPADLIGVFEMRFLLPYFGIVADDYNLARQPDGTLVFAPDLPAYRSFIELLHDWFDKGILSPEAFTNMHSAQAMNTRERATASGLLVSPTPFTHVPAEAVNQYEALLMPGPDGTIRWRDFLGNVWTGCFAVTSSCENPGEALRWVDALYGEEGALLAFAGKEGEDYVFKEDGKWIFASDTAQGINDIRASSIIYTGIPVPGLFPGDFIESVDSAADQHVFSEYHRVRAVSERVSEPFALSAEEQARASELSTTLVELVDSGIARFATGEVELTDENYAAWLDSLHAAGSDELVSLFAK